MCITLVVPHFSSPEMRGYWARDDPAFLLILCLFLTGK